MMYMPTPSEAVAEDVSAAIYALTRDAAQAASSVTRYQFGWQQAGDGTWWMEWDESSALYVHPARGQDTATKLAQYVSQGLLTQASADAIVALVQANVGAFLTLGQVTPPEWAAVMVQEMPE
jgi:hypothetical protein